MFDNLSPPLFDFLSLCYTKVVRVKMNRTILAVSVVRFEPLILLSDQIDHLPGQRFKMNR